MTGHDENKHWRQKVTFILALKSASARLVIDFCANSVAYSWC